MKGIILFSMLIACCLAAPVPDDSIEITAEVGNAPETVEVADTGKEPSPSRRVGGVVGAILGLPTTPVPAGAIVVYVKPGGVFQSRRTTTTTTTTTNTTPTTTTTTT